MSSLTDVYRSKLSVLHEEKRSLDELYEKAIMDYLVSDKAHEEIRRCYTELFCTTVLFTATKGAEPIAFEEQYDYQYTWDPEKVNRYFGTYGPAVNRALSYVGKSINNASMSYDDYFTFSLTPFESLRILMTEEQTEWMESFRYENHYFRTRYGDAAVHNFEKVLEQDAKGILYDALQNDTEVLTIMILDDEFESYVQDEFDISLQDYEDRVNELPEHLNTKENNLWDIYVTFLSTRR
jgi:hypothetical protein